MANNGRKRLRCSLLVLMTAAKAREVSHGFAPSERLWSDSKVSKIDG
jgi:hypothetical protein